MAQSHMLQKKSTVITLFAFCLMSVACMSVVAQSQRSAVWTLTEAIDYAIAHNLNVQQNVLNERVAALNLKQSQLAQLPSLNVSPSYGISRGRSIEPTSNQFINEAYSFVSAGASSNVLIFGWFAQRNTISRQKWQLAASKLDNEQFKNDLALNIATGYLRVLMAKEQIAVQSKQLELSQAQLFQTQKFADAGRVPELNVAQLEAQLASDSSAYIGALADYQSAIIDIKALLNLDFEMPFEAIAPPSDMEKHIHLQQMNPDQIYKIAVEHMPSIKSSQSKHNAAVHEWKAARANLYPQFSIGGQLGSNWTSIYKQVNGYSGYEYRSNGMYADLDGRKIDVYQPVAVPNIVSPGLFDQLSNNFRQTVSATINVPLFNGWQAQQQRQLAKVNVQSQVLAIDQASLKLKQDIYKAHNDATNAVQKYLAANRSREAAQRAFDFAVKRYELGLTNTVEYLTIQNNLYKSEASALNTKYDLLFKLKIIDYYLGKPLEM